MLVFDTYKLKRLAHWTPITIRSAIVQERFLIVPVGSSPTIRNCTFTRNWVDSGSKGGGMFLPGQSTDLIVDDCTFIDNEGGEGGGTMMGQLNTDI